MLTLYANFKGGTGKSTVVFNMAVWRLEQGHDVTVCDLDPQRTVTDVATIRAEDGIEPVLKVLHKLPTRAKAKGFTEPDPRDDLSGMDIARKVLIVARESGLDLELKDVKIDSLLTKELEDCSSIEEFTSGAHPG
jgi:cellulose biosynthesis protein BcsQ